MIEILIVIICGFFLLIALPIAYGASVMNKSWRNEVGHLIDASHRAPEGSTIGKEVESLPDPVQRYLRFAITNGTGSNHKLARLKHGGRFKNNKNGRWLTIRGEEYISTVPKGFVWYAKVSMTPLIWIKGKDKYLDGKGNMLIKLFSVIEVADGKGRDFDSGAFIRWLSEIVPLVPTIIIDPQFVWEEIDSNSAKLIVEDSGMKIQSIFHFNEKGEMTDFISDERPFVTDAKSVPMRWTVRYRKYRRFGIFMVPTEFEAVWNLPEGDFSYAIFTIESIDYY